MTKDLPIHALNKQAMKTPRAFLFGCKQTDVRVVSRPISKAVIPQIQGQPQIETDQEPSLLPE
jgi:hypothetical protein